MLHLESITKDNWTKAITLKVRQDQETFVASNVFSLAQLNFLDNFYAKGIFHDDEMVGFTLYGIDDEDQQYWMYRLMIDEKHQGKGFGTQAVRLVIEDVRRIKEPSHKTLTLSYEPENVHARDIYKRLGFEEIDGMIIEGEQIARLSLD